MRVLALADLHGHLPEIVPCDLLLLGGDLCPVDRDGIPGQERWLRERFAPWLEQLPAEYVVGVAGNHDFIFQDEPERVPELPWTYLLDETVQIDGLTVHGTPWQPVFGDWAFNLPEDDMAKRFALIPEEADVLLCHGPPRGYGDWVNGAQRRVGSRALMNAILRTRPHLCVFGHIHEGRGNWQHVHRDGSVSRLANVTHVDTRRRPRYLPLGFDMEPGGRPRMLPSLRGAI